MHSNLSNDVIYVHVQAHGILVRRDWFVLIDPLPAAMAVAQLRRLVAMLQEMYGRNHATAARAQSLADEIDDGTRS